MLSEPIAVPLRRPSAEALSAPLPLAEGLAQRLLLRGLMASLGRAVTVEGGEYLADLGQPAVFVLNHNNAVESVLAPAVLLHLRRGRSIHFLTDWMYLHLPLIGRLLRLSAPIPVYRKPARWRLGERLRQAGRKESVVEACVARLAQGKSIGLFPEGTRNPDPRTLLRGRLGLGEVVLRTGSPVIPVGLHYPAARTLGRAPHFGRLVIRVGDPLGFLAEARTAGGALPADRQRLVRRVVAVTMKALGELAEKSYPYPSADEA